MAERPEPDQSPPESWERILESFDKDESLTVRVEDRDVGVTSKARIREHFADPEVQAQHERAREIWLRRQGSADY